MVKTPGPLPAPVQALRLEGMTWNGASAAGGASYSLLLEALRSRCFPSQRRRQGAMDRCSRSWTVKGRRRRPSGTVAAGSGAEERD